MDGSAPLEITVTDDGVRLVGDIDAHTAPEMAEALSAIDRERTEVDMAGVEFVDSSGLRVLIQAHQTAQAAGRTVVLARPSNAVRRLIEISGIENYLDVTD